MSEEEEKEEAFMGFSAAGLEFRGASRKLIHLLCCALSLVLFYLFCLRSCVPYESHGNNDGGIEV